MTTLHVVLFDNTTYSITVDAFDPITFAASINENNQTMVVIGELVISRNNIKIVTPLAPDPIQ